MKSYMKGNPEVRISLNDDLVIGKKGYGTSTCILDSAMFGDTVRRNEFESSRILSFIPYLGEYTIMSYKCTGTFTLPFRVFITVEKESDYKIDVIVRIKCELPKLSYATNVLVRIPLPSSTSSTIVDFTQGSANVYEYKQKEHTILWGIKRFPGLSDQGIRIRATLASPLVGSTFTDIKKRVGPVSLRFEVPMHNISGLQIKNLKIDESKTSKNGMALQFETL